MDLPAPRFTWALPTLCSVCRAWAAERVCDACHERFAAPHVRCVRCALPVPAGVMHCAGCLREPPSLDATIAAVDYRFPWDGVVAAFKFRAGLDLAGALASMVENAVLRASSPLPLPTLLLPVPLSRERLAERGYNQAAVLARHLARRLGITLEQRLLRRLVDTPHQADLPRERRLANLRGAFGVEPRRALHLRGRSVALVDDVMTTGTTLAEAARTLKAAGAAGVQAWVFARTPAPEDR